MAGEEPTVEDEADGSLLIQFVLPKGKTETTCSEDLSYAFDQAQDNNLNPSWLEEEDCLKLNPGKTVHSIKFVVITVGPTKLRAQMHTAASGTYIILSISFFLLY